MDTIHDYTYTGKNGLWRVNISPSTGYGYFEHETLEISGSLIFIDKVLVDYDGVYELPKRVVQLILWHGYELEECIEESPVEEKIRGICWSRFSDKQLPDNNRYIHIIWKSGYEEQRLWNSKSELDPEMMLWKYR